MKASELYKQGKEIVKAVERSQELMNEVGVSVEQAMYAFQIFGEINVMPNAWASRMMDKLDEDDREYIINDILEVNSRSKANSILDLFLCSPQYMLKNYKYDNIENLAHAIDFIIDATQARIGDDQEVIFEGLL